MLKLLKIEFRKLISNPGFWVLYIFYVLFMIAGVYGSNVGNSFMAMSGANPFPIDWKALTGSFFLGFANLFLSLLVIFYVTNDYSFRIYRQNVIDGLSRVELFLAKTLTIFCLCLFTLILMFLFELLFAQLLGEGLYKQDFSANIEYLGYFFIKLFGYMCVALFLGLFLKRGAVATIALIMWFGLEMVSYFVSVFIQDKSWAKFLTYGPFNWFDKMLTNAGFTVNNAPAPSVGDVSIPLFLAGSAVYIAIFLSLSAYKLTKQNLN